MTAKKSTKDTQTNFENLEKAFKMIFDEVAELRKLHELNAKKALSVQDVMTLTGFSKWHIYKLAHERKIPYYKSAGGKSLWFNRAEIDAYLLHQKTPAVYELEQTATKHCNTHKNKMLI